MRESRERCRLCVRFQAPVAICDLLNAHAAEAGIGSVGADFIERKGRVQGILI